MFLKELADTDSTKLIKITHLLRENYEYKLNFDKLTKVKATKMIIAANKNLAESTDTTQNIKLRLIVESLTLWKKSLYQTELTDVSRLKESIADDEVEEAKVILAAKEMSSKIQTMIENAAKMQVQDLLPIVDAMRSEVGTTEADTFNESADVALSTMVEALKTGKEGLDDAISVAQGLAPATSDMDSYDDTDDLGLDDEFDDMPAADEDDNFDDMAADEDMPNDMPTGRELKDET